MELQALSPLDGRYKRHTADLSNYFSEAAYIKYRIKVEVEYFIALCEIPLPSLASFDKSYFSRLRSLYEDFTLDVAQRVKDIEKITNHDVKAVEYYIKEEFDRLNLSAYKEFIHFGLTSQDINNTAVPMMTMDAMTDVTLPVLNDVVNQLKVQAKEWKNVPMLARTHGQPASPTLLGKEVKVFVERLEAQIGELLKIDFWGKFGGATGNFNAHHIAYSEIDWVAFANNFLSEKLKLRRLQTTTQIEHYDFLAAYFDGLKRINTIIIDLDRDIWTYISMEYFKQKIKKNEVGSSAMPHKVNPIDFENSEGNLGLANAILSHLSEKLPISRLQRDLTDSTVTRNIGMPLGYMLIAYKSLLKGLDKLILNEEKIRADLDNNWAVIAEAIQTVLRREGVENPYEKLKALSRTNETLNQASFATFIDSLDIKETLKAELKQITPWNYTGIS